ncbi:MAG: DUF1289 domain-containing protein [Pseudomonadota bacterium]
MNGTDPQPSITSPCVKVCQLDENDVCLGCGRSLDEIGAWSRASNAERRRILENAAARLPRQDEGLP